MTKKTATLTSVILATFLLGLSAVGGLAQEQPMGFFITSVGPGDGADLGGLEGADAHCQARADAAGAGNRTWRAYLSTQGPGAVNARDRIGDGPWANVNGLIMATSVENLHYDNSNFNWEHSLDENGEQFPSRIDGDPDFSEHDVLTGSQIDAYSLGARYGRVSSAFAKARQLGMAREKGEYVPIPGDAFIMATSKAEKGKYKFTGTGHIGYVLRVEVSRGKAVTINTVEGNSSNRVKLGKRDLSDSSIVGFINNYGTDEQPTNWQKGLVSATDTSGTATR